LQHTNDIDSAHGNKVERQGWLGLVLFGKFNIRLNPFSYHYQRLRHCQFRHKTKIGSSNTCQMVAVMSLSAANAITGAGKAIPRFKLQAPEPQFPSRGVNLPDATPCLKNGVPVLICVAKRVMPFG